MYVIGKEELEKLEELFASGKLFRYQGTNVSTETSRFEEEFATFLGMKHSLLVTSGTNSLILALEALGIGNGDEVIIPSYTFMATAAAVRHVGATPVLAMSGKSLSLSRSAVEKRITRKTKAIIPVHMDGLNCPMNELTELAREHQLHLIEDVAQAVGGSYQGSKLGSFGVAGCFSFNAEKIISCGEGGAVAFKNEDHFKKALLLHDSAIRFGPTFRDYLKEEPIVSGHSMRVSEISGPL